MAMMTSSAVCRNSTRSSRRRNLMRILWLVLATFMFFKQQYYLTRREDSIILKEHLWKRISPIVVPERKLIYFYTPKNGCTTWKRILQTAKNVTVGEQGMLVHGRNSNGLEYLDHYNLSIANQWLADPEWHKFIVVRDPKERFLSAYLDKGKPDSPFVKKCCKSQRNPLACLKKSSESADGFFDMMQFCNDVHWLPQTPRLTDKLWSTINFVAHFETFGEDSIAFAEHIRLPEHAYKDKLVVRPHSTNASEKMKQYISRELEEKLDEYYKVDYDNKLLGYKRYSIYS